MFAAPDTACKVTATEYIYRKFGRFGEVRLKLSVIWLRLGYTREFCESS